MKGFGDAKVGKDKSPRLHDLVDTFEWPTDDYATIRLIGPVFSYRNIWFDILTKAGKKVSIPKQCLDHDGLTDDLTTDICPYRASGKGRESKYYVVNAIIRPIQEEKKRWPKPEGKKVKHLGYECYLTKKGAKNTPVRVIVINSSSAEKIQQMQKLNRVVKKDGSKKTYEAGDPKFGFDLNIMFDPSKEGARKYDVQKGDRTPLTDDELNYPLYRLDLLKSDPLDRAKREMEDLSPKIVEKDEKKGANKKRSRDEDDEDEEDEKPRKGKKSAPVDDDDLTDLDEDDLGLDLDEDDEKPAKKKKKKSRDEDEDDEKPAKKKKRPPVDEDEEDDEEEEEDEDAEDEDDEDGDSEDEDEEEDDEDEDDEPVKKKSSSSSKKKKGAPSKPVKSSKNKSSKNKKRRRDDD